MIDWFELLTFVVFLGGGVVRAAFDDFLNMFWFHVDGHGSDDGTVRWGRDRFEPNRTCGGHANKQLLETF